MRPVKLLVQFFSFCLIRIYCVLDINSNFRYIYADLYFFEEPNEGCCLSVQKLATTMAGNSGCLAVAKMFSVFFLKHCWFGS